MCYKNNVWYDQDQKVLDFLKLWILEIWEFLFKFDYKIDWLKMNYSTSTIHGCSFIFYSDWEFYKFKIGVDYLKDKYSKGCTITEVTHVNIERVRVVIEKVFWCSLDEKDSSLSWNNTYNNSHVFKEVLLTIIGKEAVKQKLGSRW